MKTDYTEKQGQYLAFIDTYIIMNEIAPAESDMLRFFRTTPPTVHQMVMKLEEKGFISRVPRTARSIKLLVSTENIPKLKQIK